jgi:hypothetical protein
LNLVGVMIKLIPVHFRKYYKTVFKFLLPGIGLFSDFRLPGIALLQLVPIESRRDIRLPEIVMNGKSQNYQCGQDL